MTSNASLQLVDVRFDNGSWKATFEIKDDGLLTRKLDLMFSDNKAKKDETETWNPSMTIEDATRKLRMQVAERLKALALLAQQQLDDQP